MELTRINATGELKKPGSRLLLDFLSDVNKDGLSEIILVIICDSHFE